jgi:Cell Wall Hydrolase
MSGSRIGWAGSVVAPWCLAVGVLLSITAEAEQETPYRSVSAFDRAPLPGSDDPTRSGASAPRAVDEDGVPLPLIRARFTVGDPNDPAGLEIEPKGTLKDPAPRFPEVDRTGKGDPFVGLRPGFDAKRRSRQGKADPDWQSWPHELQDPRDAEFDPGHTMSPLRPGDREGATDSGATSFGDGATPAISLDFALNSSSPTSSDGVVVAEQSDPSQTTVAEQSALGAGQPNYAAFVEPKDSARQMRCLAEAIYFESRSEPEAGQAAVAQVVLNRVRSGIYPTTICGVVYQDRSHPFACQFSFACEGKSLRIEEPGPWAVATRIAEEVVSGRTYNSRVAEAVNYHANYVSPFWVGYLRKVDHIGAHIFYAMRDGVNWAPGALNGHGDKP